MKKTIVLAFMAMAIVAVPASAQSKQLQKQLNKESCYSICCRVMFRKVKSIG